MTGMTYTLASENTDTLSVVTSGPVSLQGRLEILDAIKNRLKTTPISTVVINHQNADFLQSDEDMNEFDQSVEEFLRSELNVSVSIVPSATNRSVFETTESRLSASDLGERFTIQNMVRNLSDSLSGKPTATPDLHKNLLSMFRELQIEADQMSGDDDVKSEQQLDQVLSKQISILRQSAAVPACSFQEAACKLELWNAWNLPSGNGRYNLADAVVSSALQDLRNLLVKG